MHAAKPKSETAYHPSPLGPWKGRLRRAFTLVEVLIVIAIFGILAAMAVPYLSSNVPQQLQMAADTVADDFVYARGLAVANNSSYRFTFDIATNSYTYVLQHSGTNTALNKLPPSPFHTFNAGSTQQTADLSKLPLLYGVVKLAAVQRNPAAPSGVLDLEFGPLGNTTRTDVTIIWLVSSDTGTKMYIPVTVNPTTGIVDVGNVRSATPSGITP